VMGVVSVGVVKESAPGERRVAVVPEVVPRLTALGLEVLVETDAGVAAWLRDSSYREAGAAVVSGAELDERADILLCVGTPPLDRVARLRTGQTLIGMLNPANRDELTTICAGRGITAISLDLLPRTLSRAQAMDALSSQATIAGYRAVLVGAHAYGRYFPMLITAAGTAKPAQLLVLGAGVAGLAAIGTARRLGAIVTGYDIRPQTREEVRSLGARFLDLRVPGAPEDGSGEGGYARALTDDERAAQQQALQQRIADFDVVITTAQIPGRRPPVLVTGEALKGMRPGSVVVDIAAGPLGGNVAGSVPDQITVSPDGVIVIGAGNLPSEMAPAASVAYARNLAALLTHLCPGGVLTIDPGDEIVSAMLLRAGAGR
jgi:H+-translocating NAD(P) transhydrogenase subunit alpha